MRALPLTAALVGASLCHAPLAHADILCKRIGDDPYNIREELAVSGPTATYTYTATGNERVTLTSLECAQVRGVAPPGSTICTSTHKWERGLTIETYYLESNEGDTWLTHITFTENSRLVSEPEKHRSTLETIEVECRSPTAP